MTKPNSSLFQVCSPVRTASLLIRSTTPLIMLTFARIRSPRLANNKTAQVVLQGGSDMVHESAAAGAKVFHVSMGKVCAILPMMRTQTCAQIPILFQKFWQINEWGKDQGLKASNNFQMRRCHLQSEEVFTLVLQERLWEGQLQDSQSPDGNDPHTLSTGNRWPFVSRVTLIAHRPLLFMLSSIINWSTAAVPRHLAFVATFGEKVVI
jgi:hypothetical protein